jgi:ankyrin repeat protein
LNYAAGNGHLEVVRFLVEQGVDIQDDALKRAAANGRLDVVKFLVEHGADDINNWPLGWAAKYGHLEVVRFLVENGADIHAMDDGALRHALRHATANQHAAVVDFFNELINARDYFGDFIRG